MAFNRLGCGILVAMLLPLGLLAACPPPAWNQSALTAIKAESDSLMAAYPVKPPEKWVTIPKDRWSPAIATLEPEMVTVFEGAWIS